jgi:hypothetical protein
MMPPKSRLHECEVLEKLRGTIRALIDARSL